MSSRRSTYLYVFEPYDKVHPGPAEGTLADDVADIYRDLSPGLKEWTGTNAATRRDIVSSWKSPYAYHWGWDAARASLAMHSLLYYHIKNSEGGYVGIPVRNAPRRGR